MTVSQIKFRDMATHLCSMEGGAKKALNAAQAGEALKCVCQLFRLEIDARGAEGAAAVVMFINKHGD